MNFDENYWRELAAKAQAAAAAHYKLARTYAAHPGGRHLARVYQGIAHETSLKAIGRLGLAAEERRASEAAPGMFDGDNALMLPALDAEVIFAAWSHR